MYLVNYTSILIILFLAAAISTIVFLLSLIIYFQILNKIEKNSTYECGFTPFGDARERFEVKFYLVSILFIVFDLEIAFLFPCILAFPKYGMLGLAITVSFLVLLILGFLYELMTGAMDW